MGSISAGHWLLSAQISQAGPPALLVYLWLGVEPILLGTELQALAFFNLGVELGQLVFVAAVWLAIGLWRWRRWPAPLWLRRCPGNLLVSWDPTG